MPRSIEASEAKKSNPYWSRIPSDSDGPCYRSTAIKGIVSRDFDVILRFYGIDVKFILGPDQVYLHFNFVFKFK
jgi:hypothetical protein